MMATYTVRSGKRLLYVELSEKELVQALRDSILEDGTELYKNGRLDVTYVIRDGKLETWKGRVVANSNGFVRKVIPNLERLVD